MLPRSRGGPLGPSGGWGQASLPVLPRDSTPQEAEQGLCSVSPAFLPSLTPLSGEPRLPLQRGGPAPAPPSCGPAAPHPDGQSSPRGQPCCAPERCPASGAPIPVTLLAGHTPSSAAHRGLAETAPQHPRPGQQPRGTQGSAYPVLPTCGHPEVNLCPSWAAGRGWGGPAISLVSGRPSRVFLQRRT